METPDQKPLNVRSDPQAIQTATGVLVGDAVYDEPLPSMTDELNKPGMRLSCVNPDCSCRLEIVEPCPHGVTYTCACGHRLAPAET